MTTTTKTLDRLGTIMAANLTFGKLNGASRLTDAEREQQIAIAYDLIPMCEDHRLGGTRRQAGADHLHRRIQVLGERAMIDASAPVRTRSCESCCNAMATVRVADCEVDSDFSYVCESHLRDLLDEYGDPTRLVTQRLGSPRIHRVCYGGRARVERVRADPRISGSPPDRVLLPERPREHGNLRRLRRLERRLRSVRGARLSSGTR